MMVLVRSFGGSCEGVKSVWSFPAASAANFMNVFLFLSTPKKAVQRLKKSLAMNWSFR